MTPEEKILFYGLLATVALLVAQVAVLQNQVGILQKEIDDLELPEIPEALNYTTTGDITSVIELDVNVVDEGQWPFVWSYVSYNLMKNYWGLMRCYIYGEKPENTNLTLVVLVHYDNFNSTQAMNGLDALLQLEWNGEGEYYENATMAESINGNCIQFEATPYDNGGYHAFYLRVSDEMPNGHYSVIAYLRE